MIRNRFPRFPQKGRNLQNLHVIPTESVNIEQKQSNSAVIQITPTENVSTDKNFHHQNKNTNSYKRKYKRKRKRAKAYSSNKPFVQNSTFDWYNSDYVEAVVPPLEKSEKEPEKIESTSDVPGEENYFEEVEVASVEAESKQETLVRFRQTKPCYLKYKKKGHFKPKFYKIADPTFVNCSNVQDDVDVDIVSEAEYEYENDNLDQGDSPEAFNKILEVADSEDDNDQAEEKEKSQNAGTASELLVDSTKRVYKTCIKENGEFTQGKSLIQDSLDSWKSHLLGLEYLVEIQNVNKSSVLKYHCALCLEDLEIQGFPAVCVINHINNYKHVVRYLEKHFPTHGYKFAKNIDYNFYHLEKLSEKINESLGYYYMCVSSLEYYVKNSQKIKKIIKNAYHPNEKDFALDKNSFEQKIDSDLKDEIENIVSNIVEKALLLKDDTVVSEICVNKSIPKAKQSNVQVSVPNDDSVKIVNTSEDKIQVSGALNSKSKRGRPRCTVYKGNNALTCYMALSQFANTALKSVKKKSNVTEKTSNAKKNELDTFHKVVQNVHSEVAENVNCAVIWENDENIIHEKEISIRPETEEKVCHEAVKGEDHEIVEENVENEAGVDEHHEDDFEDALSTVIQPNTNQIDYKDKEKVLLKTSTMHSKYCRKRILGKESSRLKLSVRGTTKAVSGVSKKCSVKHKSFTETAGLETSNKITSTNKEKVNLVKTVKSTQKKTPVHKVISIEKASINSKSSLTKHSVPHHRNIHKKDSEDSFTDQISVTKSTPSVWKPIARTSKSPVKSSTSDSTHLLRSPSRKQSSPSRRTIRKLSRSPTKRIKSPIKHVIRSSFTSTVKKHSKSPLRRYSRSPLRKKSRSPLRKKSRSPLRKKSRSPLTKKSRSPLTKKSRSPLTKKSRSPLRKKSRSPLRKKSRSPIRKKSRSPLKRHSRSPLRRHSRSPLRHHARSPIRCRSRSPLRRYSRSPLRRHSRSPVRRRSRSLLRYHSRSPLRRHSRSPMKRHSRSPLRRYSRSPIRHISRSPVRHHSRSPLRYSRSPVKRRARSPDRRHSRSPLQKFSKISDKYRSTHRVHSPDYGHSHHFQKHFSPEERTSSSIYNYEKHLSEFSKVKETSKMLSSSKKNTSEKFKSQPFPHTSVRGISDLDPVSDEDESLYFSDKNQRVDEDNISPSSKIMLAKLLQKFSMDVNPNDPALNKLLQFMEAHSAEIQNLVGSQPKSDNTSITKVDTSLQERSLFLQQYLLSNLAGSNQEPRLTSPVLNMPSKFARPQFLQPLGLGHLTNVPPPTISQPTHQRFFPPNINVPPPQLFHQLNQPHQDFSPKPNVAPEVMFKDLKATVNKLFGAMTNETLMKQEKPQMPGYVTEPDPEKWDLNHPDTLKFNASVSSKNTFNPQGKNIEFSNISHNPVTREEIPMYSNNNPSHGQFFSTRDITRPQIPTVPIPPPDAKVSFCEVSRGSAKGNLFPVLNTHANQNFNASSSHSGVNDVKVSLAQRLASVLVKVGMIDVPAPLLQEMLMKIGAFSSSPRQDISEAEIISILKRLGYLS